MHSGADHEMAPWAPLRPGVEAGDWHARTPGAVSYSESSQRQ
jgi:hypothetical protein